jgi:hypothetical protein
MSSRNAHWRFIALRELEFCFLLPNDEKSVRD